MSDRIAVFNDGAIQQLDTPTALYERPPTPSSPASSARTTVCAGTLASVSGDACIVRLDGGAAIAASHGRCRRRRQRRHRLAAARAHRDLTHGRQGGGRVNRAAGAACSELIYLGDHLRRADRAGRQCGLHGEAADRTGRIASPRAKRSKRRGRRRPGSPSRREADAPPPRLAARPAADYSRHQATNGRAIGRNFRRGGRV